jgi:hypothetical protein
VTKSDAPVFVSVMGRLAMVQAMIQQAGEVPDNEDAVRMVSEFAENGTYSRELLDEYGLEPTCFSAHFFRVAELERLLERCDLRVDRIVGLEGVASLRRVGSDLDDVAPEKREAVDDAVELLREDRSVADVSTHILAVARTP